MTETNTSNIVLSYVIWRGLIPKQKLPVTDNEKTICKGSNESLNNLFVMARSYNRCSALYNM